jgi:uncharacterized membrane protein
MSTSNATRIPVLGGLLGEGWTLARALGSPALYLVALVASVLIVATYQVRPTYQIVAGGPTDRPFLGAIHSSERDPNLQRTYRWTQPESVIQLPGVGRQDFSVRLELSGARPEGFPPPEIQIFSRPTAEGPERLLLTAQPAPDLQWYEFRVERDPDLSNGDLRLVLRTTNPFTPEGDPRELGVRLFHVTVTPLDTPQKGIIPPIQHAMPLLAAALFCTLTLAYLGWAPGMAALAGLIWSLGTAAFLIWDRTWLTSASSVLPQAWIAALVMLFFLRPLVGVIYRWAGVAWPVFDRRVLLTIFALAVVARLGGQLHPEVFSPDVNFHANRLVEVMGGKLLFTVASAEWAYHRTFYLPTVYLFMTPFQWLLDDRFLTVRVFTVLLDTSSVFMLYILARQALGSGRAGLWASILFVTFPQGVLLFSWGTTANMFAQWTMLAAITFVIVAYERLHRPLVWGLLLVVAFLALMSHPGTVQLTGVMLGITLVLWAWRRREVGPMRSWWLLGAGVLVAAVVAFFAYYINWVDYQLNELAAIQAERAANAAGGFRARVGGSVNDVSMNLYSYTVYTREAQILEGLWGFWKEAWAYYKTMPLAWTALGLLAIAPATRILRRFRTAAVGWGLSAAIFAVIGLTSNLYVRYPLFLLPLIALGSGALLEWLRRRGWAGQALTACVLAAFVVNGLALWWWRIQFYLK